MEGLSRGGGARRRDTSASTHHDAGVDVAERAEAEQVGAVLGRVEGVGGGLVDGHGARVGRGVGLLPGVHLQGLELELRTGHSDQKIAETRMVGRAAKARG